MKKEAETDDLACSYRDGKVAFGCFVECLEKSQCW